VHRALAAADHTADLQDELMAEGLEGPQAGLEPVRAPAGPATPVGPATAAGPATPVGQTPPAGQATPVGEPAVGGDKSSRAHDAA
jgi:hypothetical protein